MGTADQESGQEERQSRNSWLNSQCQGDVSAFPKALQGVNTREQGGGTLSANEGVCLRKPWGGRKASSPSPGPFAEGLLRAGTACLPSRLSWGSCLG